ncbi:unnamed protein product, partial [Didymodactylos carnosus]
DDVVCLSMKHSKQLGNIGPICICSKITQNVYLIDPQTLKIAVISSTEYWRHPFQSICDSKHLVEYIVCDVNLIDSDGKPHVYGKESTKHALAEVYVMKASEIGFVDKQYITITHLGHLLHPGDSVLGFDLQNSNVSNTSLETYNMDKLPDVILVKKLYADKSLRNRKRKWKLKHLNVEDAVSGTSNDRDYTDFLEDLEEDPTLRQNVMIYKDEKKLHQIDDEKETIDIPQIGLEEMMSELKLDEDETQMKVDS